MVAATGYPRILAVGETPSILSLIRDAFEGQYEVVSASGMRQALAAVDGRFFDLALIDLPASPPQHGALVDGLRAASPGLPILILSSEPRIPELARELGVDAWVQKPFLLGELRHTVAVTLAAAAALAPFRPASHWVRFYRSSLEPAASVAAFIAAGLRRSEGVVAVARPGLRVEVESLLRMRRTAPAPGQLLWIDAEGFIAHAISEQACRLEILRETVGGWFEEVRRGGFADLRVFGEGVDLLARKGSFDLARQLEQIWRGIAARERLHVY